MEIIAVQPERIVCKSLRGPGGRRDDYDEVEDW